jgi:hypothetical protein
MGLFSKHMQTMDDLLPHGLQDVYYAENPGGSSKLVGSSLPHPSR